MFIGLALATYPYFIESTVTLCAIGLAGTAALFWASQLSRRSGGSRRFRMDLRRGAQYSAADVR